MTDDPVAAALADVTAGLPDADAVAVARLVRAGLDRMDTTAPPEFLAREEIAPAAALDPAERLGWAREFAVAPVVARLDARAWRLATALIDGERPAGELAAEAGALLDELEAVDLDDLAGERRDRLLRRRNQAIADARWVLAGGEGPASLRAGRRRHRR